jgi:hypothetical protein
MGIVKPVQWPGWVLENRVIIFKLLLGSKTFSLLQNIHTGTGSRPSFLSNRYQGLFLLGYVVQGMKLNTHSIQCRGWKCVELYFHSHMRLHDMLKHNLTITASRYYAMTNLDDWRKLKILIVNQFGEVISYLSTAKIWHILKKWFLKIFFVHRTWKLQSLQNNPI